MRLATRMKLASRVRAFHHRLWRAMRALSGDDAYERYVAHLRSHHPDEAPPSAADFYVLEQERRWNSGPGRCC
jgi:uncharacterized short protein YbdD (DUF466 family)